MTEVSKLRLEKPDLFPGRKREIVELLISHHTTTKDIADKLGISEDTVRAHLYKQPDTRKGSHRVTIWSIVEEIAEGKKIENLTGLLEYMISTGIVAVVPINSPRD